MIAILLAVLGVPLWLVVGAFGGALWSRRRYLRQPEVFRLRLRTGDDWPRRDAFGQLVHDVLVVNTGVALVRTSVYGLAGASSAGAIDGPPPDGLASVLRLDLDDGSSVLIAVRPDGADRFDRLLPVSDATVRDDA